MDKRYFLIIVIVCICCINLYMISNVSDVIGSASVDVGKYTFSLPSGFTLYSDSSSDVMISNPSDSNLKVYINNSLDDDDNYMNRVNLIKNNSKIYSNGSIMVGDIEIKSIYYSGYDDSINRSAFYFNKLDNNFKIVISNFNYDLQKNETIDIVTQIVESIRVNYKI